MYLNYPHLLFHNYSSTSFRIMHTGIKMYSSNDKITFVPYYYIQYNTIKYTALIIFSAVYCTGFHHPKMAPVLDSACFTTLGPKNFLTNIKLQSC
jgi:hypothetical protein